MALHPKTKRFQRISLRPAALPEADKRTRSQMRLALDNIDVIDPDDRHFRNMLQNLQGNILKGHGRNHTAHLFFKIEATPEAARAAISRIATRYVTSALQQHAESEVYKAHGIPGTMFGNIFLTASGYKALGFSEQQIARAFKESPGDAGIQSNFCEGMKAHGKELNDPDPSKWEAPYSCQIDAMILLADDEEEFLQHQVALISKELNAVASMLTVEKGHVRRDEMGRSIEHFGYVNGRSQPVFFTTDIEPGAAAEKWDPAAPLGLTLVPDNSTEETECFGSYMVFRKLEQDVQGFKKREQELADELGLVGEDRDRLGAMIFGRFKDGTPLALSKKDGLPEAKSNDFTYDEDAAGQKCPFHAHARKANPRGDIERQIGLAGTTRDLPERSRRIVRRSMPYGKCPEQADNPSDSSTPGESVGMLFMCFQSSIANQFAYIQSQWLNNENFVRGATGADPVAGQASSKCKPIPQVWTTQWGQMAIEPGRFGGFVRMMGGEFFFTPSIPFLKGLASRRDLEEPE